LRLKDIWAVRIRLSQPEGRHSPATGRGAVGQLRSVGHLNYYPKGDNGIAIAPPLNIRTLQY